MGSPPCYDVLGIGFGPANIALAAAMEEAFEEDGGTLPTMKFLEGEVDPVWQGGMLLDGSNIQNNPIRDLVTLRNPRSRHSYINYLHQSGRLLSHLNLPQEFPLRREYAQYIGWVRRSFDHLVGYGRPVVSVEVVRDGGRRVWELTTRQRERYRGRSLVMGTGRTPYVPPPFSSLDDDRVLHLTRYLYRLHDLDREPRSVAVIGGSQSAVEIVLDLARRLPRTEVHLCVRSFGLRLKDTSPFSEEGFFPEFTDYYYQASRAGKRILDAYMRPTNYSAADADVLHELYLLLYEQGIKGRQRVHVHRNHAVRKLSTVEGGLVLAAEDVHTGEPLELTADLIVLATGFRDLGPAAHQEPYPPLLAGVADSFAFDSDGYLAIDPDYRVVTEQDGTPPLFLNGLCETSHGIGDAGSFSLLSLRAGTLCRRLTELTTLPRAVATRPAPTARLV
ncbi:SidA/IucD/PvdA family monooxygenase [Streptomyces sp. NPDC050610]|uniref:SidA/IucD/PvdA family monooxygenase n=1 Tax=Streptomyces sp. NPDC050610 TaxID=3157097 RepID=UPI0034190941